MKTPLAGGATPIGVALPHLRRVSWRERLLENERLLAVALLCPAVSVLVLFIAYPFVMGIWFSLTSISVGNEGQFVGLRNFAKVWDDSIFQQAFRNTVFYTFWATVLKLGLGMWLALLLNRHFKFKRLVRASMLLPFIIPTVLSTFAWRWMFDPTFSVLNWSAFKLGFIAFAAEPGPDTGIFQTALYHLGLVRSRPLPFLPDGTFAMWCAILINTWRGMPFFAITLLAGLQTINPDLHEAASLDGASAWHRFWKITWPLLKPVTLVVVVFSVIQTFSDFQLIYVLTGGGPANSTHLIATYAYQLGVATGLLGEGAAISLFMFPVLFVVVWIQLRYLRRMEGA